MKELLTLIKTELSGVFDGLRDQDIYFLPDADILPSGARLPCIGIKDGTTEVSLLSGDALEMALQVEVYYFDKLGTGDIAILDYLGKSRTLFDRLRDNDLAGYVREVTPRTITPVMLMVTEAGLILRKGLKFEYEKLEE